MLIANCSWAYKITIDVNGSGSVTVTPTPGGQTITFDCKESPSCCGSYTIETKSTLPSIGDKVSFIECDRVKENVIHSWHGLFLGYEYSSDRPNYLRANVAELVQEF